MNPGVLTPPTQFAALPRGLLGRPTPVPMVGMREFLPTQIAGLDGWWDAADESTVALSGGLVSVWADKSGNGRTASQSDSSLRPAYNATQNRRRALNWTGGIRQLSLPPVSYSSGTLFVVADDKNGLGNAWLSLSSSNSSYLMSGFNADNGWEFGYGANAKSPGWSGGVVSICAAEFGGGTSRLFLNGVGGASTPTSPAVAIDQFGRYARQAGYVANGACCEIIFYNRRLSAGERQQVEGYLSEKWGIPLASRGPQSSNADAQDWINRVYLNGGTVSTSTALAVTSFCNDINAAGIRDRFYRLSLFAGENLAAALTPLFRAESLTASVRGNATDTNNGPFVAADFNNTGSASGLKANGTTKWLNTGVPANSIAASDAMLGFGLLATDTVGPAFRAGIGAFTTAASIGYALEIRRNDSNRSSLLGVYNPPSYYGDLIQLAPLGVGNMVQTFPTLYRNATPSGSAGTAATNYPSPHSMYVFCVNNGAAANAAVSLTDSRIGWYCIGLSMTQAQVTAFNNALNAFNSTLSRT